MRKLVAQFQWLADAPIVVVVRALRRRTMEAGMRWFCQVTGLASGLKVANLVADIVERLPDAAFDPAILSEQS
jgi:hypothetical protein